MITGDVTTTSTAPLAISAVVAAFLGLFPIVLARRIANAEADESTTKQAKYTLYLITASVVCLHVAEATKSALFGIAYYQQGTIFGILSQTSVALVSFLFIELARMLCTATVLMRVADLVVPPAGLDSAMDNRLKLIFVVAGFRILFPLFVIWGGVEPSLFGQFVAWMLAADIFVFVFASVLVNAHLKRVQRVDPISHLSRTVLYSNSITTQVLAVFALFFSLVIGLISPQKSQINQIALDIFPSIYHLVLGFMLTFFYWDVKQLIQNPEAGRNKGLRRVKFSMSSILQ